MRLNRDLFDWERALMTEGRLYLVGGAVRDMIMGNQARGYDEDYLLAGMSIEEAVTVLEDFGRCNLVGKSFGVLKFTPEEGRPVDIALPRKEFSTGWGHRDFDVNFSPDLPVEEDLLRRDFTMNSIALELKSMELVDPLGGKQDIEDRLMRVNHDDSFREDPLRIIRGVQFKYRFALEVESKTEKLMLDCAHMVSTIAAERVREELNKMMLLAENPGDGFMYMHQAGVLKYIIPELEETFGIEQNEYHPDDLFTHSIRSCNLAEPDLLIRWSALLHDLGKKETKREKDGRTVFYTHEIVSEKKAKTVMKRLRFSRSFTASLLRLIRNHMFMIDRECSDSAVRRFVTRVGLDNVEDLFSLRRADALSRGDTESINNIEYVRKRVEEVVSADSAFKIKDLKISGAEVMEIAGIPEGPLIGDILRELFERVLENPELNRNDTLREIVASKYGC